MKRSLIPILIVLMLATLACSVNINLPKVETGPDQTFTVDVPAAKPDQTTNLTMEMGAGIFNLSGGADKLIEGTVVYNAINWKPQLVYENNNLTLTQGKPGGFRSLSGENIKNTWDIQLGSTPIDLTIRAGAYQGNIDLSGLRLTGLDISDGASQADLKFTKPNPEKMGTFNYRTGASQVKLVGLGYANFSQMTFEGGAGSYTLDFTGKLNRDASVTVKAGICDITIVVPEGTKAVVNMDESLNNVNLDGTWNTSGHSYTTAGEGPVLDIHIDMGLGNLTLVYK